MKGPPVLILRAREDVAPLQELLRGEGLVALSLPLLFFEPVLEPVALRELVADFCPHWILLTSPRAARVLHGLPEGLGVAVGAVGPATAAAAREAGLSVSLEGGGKGALALGRLFLQQEAKAPHQRLLWPRGDRALPGLGILLAKTGHELREVVVYKTRLLCPEEETLREMVGRARAILFSSPSTVEALCRAARKAGILESVVTLPAGALGESTWRALRGAGFGRVVLGDEAGLKSLARALARELLNGPGSLALS